MAQGGPGTFHAMMYLADVNGYADKVGLDLNVQNVQANVLNVVLAGQGDIGMSGMGAAVPPMIQGKDMKVVYTVQSAAISGFVVAKDGIDSIKDCSRMATNQVGSTSNAVTELYKSATGSSWPITVFGTNPAVSAAVLSGQNDCATSALSVVGPAVTDGYHLLVDPTDPSTLPDKELLLATGNALWGLGDRLESKRSAVVKLMKALRMALDYIRSTPIDKVAADLTKVPMLDGWTIEQLKQGLEIDIPLFAPNDGQIEDENWQQNLRLYKFAFPKVGEGGDDKWAYANRVDMSYLNSAGDTK